MIGATGHVIATVSAIRFALSAQCGVLVDAGTRKVAVRQTLHDVLRPWNWSAADCEPGD